MSVILAYQSEERIIIAGDKQGSDKQGNLVKDNLNKVFVVNQHLAVAIAGNCLFELAIKSKLDEIQNTSNLVIEDILNKIIDFYKYLKVTAPLYLELPACFIVGGMAKNGMCGIFAFIGNKGDINPIETERAIFPPIDMKPKDCENIFIKNIESNPSDFYIHTIKEAANKSKVVNSTGDAWIFNLKTKTGKLEHF